MITGFRRAAAVDASTDKPIVSKIFELIHMADLHGFATLAFYRTMLTFMLDFMAGMLAYHAKGYADRHLDGKAGAEI